MGSSLEPEASCCCMCVLILSREDWVQGELFQAGASREIVFGPRLNLSLALSSLSLVRSFLDRGHTVAVRCKHRRNRPDLELRSESGLATIHPTCHLQDLKGWSSDGVERGGQQGFPVRMRIFKGGVGLQKLWTPTKFNLALPVVCPEGPCGCGAVHSVLNECL